MGKKWFKKKNKVKEDGSKPNRGKFERPKRERPAVAYEDLVRESKDFETYYKAQKIVSEEQWEPFITCLKEDLPAAFRFTGSKSHAQALLKVMQDKFFVPLTASITDAPSGEIESNGKETVKPLKPICLPWYPDKLAWQLNLTRKDIRSSEAYWKLHQFLIIETETGNISRQEAVSMIPPLLLDVKHNHKVLDMCAAPGSKTAQIIEFLHSSLPDDASAIPSGVVVANDSDNKRCYMLTHQAKRLQSPTLMITNHDAAFMPNLHCTRKDGTVGPMKFDRVLCDVPCSGDGTLRKNFDVWTKWNAANGANLHGLQLRIARRGLEMLEVGGRLVYSTCSLNPLENEAVINRLLAESGGSVCLVDVAEKLPGLKFMPGIESWTIMNKELEVVASPENIPPKNTNLLHKHLFPPTPEECAARNLKRCIRILPHDQDTGGFFVAVLEKQKPLPGEKVYLESEQKVPEQSEATGDQQQPPELTQRVKPPPKKRRCRGFREEPFYYMDKDNALWKGIFSFYGFDEGVDPSLFLTRTLNGKGKNLYFTNALVRDLVKLNEERVKIINTGVKVLVRCDNKGSTCDFRLAQDGSQVLLPLFTKRKLYVTKDDLVIMLLNEDVEVPPQIDSLHPDTQLQCPDLDCGSVAFIYEGKCAGEEYKLEIDLVGWKGKNSVRCYVAKNERLHFLRLLGADTSAFEKNKFAEQRLLEEKTEELFLESEDGNPANESPVFNTEDGMEKLGSSKEIETSNLPENSKMDDELKMDVPN